jgi:hypothetical protein
VGLEQLGFPVSHLSSLHRFQTELSHDRTGVIREAQFITAFRALNRHTLEAALAKGDTDGRENEEQSIIHIIDMGYTHVDGIISQQYEEQTVNSAGLASALGNTSHTATWHKKVRWIDVCGLHSRTTHLLANELNLPGECLRDVELEQVALCECE